MHRTTRIRHLSIYFASNCMGHRGFSLLSVMHLCGNAEGMVPLLSERSLCMMPAIQAFLIHAVVTTNWCDL